MTDDHPTEPRFMVRRDAKPGRWMVWDRQTRGPALLEHGRATGLSEEEAREILEELRLAYGEG